MVWAPENALSMNLVGWNMAQRVKTDFRYPFGEDYPLYRYPSISDGFWGGHRPPNVVVLKKPRMEKPCILCRFKIFDQ